MLGNLTTAETRWNVYLSGGANSTLCELSDKSKWDLQNKQRRDNTTDSFPFIVAASDTTDTQLHTWYYILASKTPQQKQLQKILAGNWLHNILWGKVRPQNLNNIQLAPECSFNWLNVTKTQSVNYEDWRDNGFESATSPSALPIWHHICWWQQHEMGGDCWPNASSASASSTCWWVGVHPGADGLNTWKVRACDFFVTLLVYWPWLWA